MAPLDTKRIRQDFPMLAGAKKGFAYLDSASSSQTPVQVLEAMENYYRHFRANVHRGMYGASERATEHYEGVRRKVADMIRGREDEIVFTRGATESLNLAARCLGKRLQAGDEVVLSVMEHHANLVPWQQMAKERGFSLKFIPLTAERTLDLAAAGRMIGPRTKVVSILHASNVLGTIVPVADIAAMARKVGAAVVVDAAQTAGHVPVDVAKLGCDLLAFSAHKMLGPTGAGVLWGKKALLEEMDPFLFGGDMIQEVFFDHSTWNAVPYKFEAGTPNIAGVIGLGAAVDYVTLTGIDAIAAHEKSLVAYALERLSEIPGLAVYGPPEAHPRTGVISFEVPGIHPHDMATILDAEGVCVRGGHHCAMPLLRELGLQNGTTRASFSLYSTTEDAEALARGIVKAKKIFRI